jgi:hypothetical protein
MQGDGSGVGNEGDGSDRRSVQRRVHVYIAYMTFIATITSFCRFFHANVELLNPAS